MTRFSHLAELDSMETVPFISRWIVLYLKQNEESSNGFFFSLSNLISGKSNVFFCEFGQLQTHDIKPLPLLEHHKKLCYQEQPRH